MRGINVSAFVDTRKFDATLEEFIIQCGTTVAEELKHQCKLLVGGSRESAGLIDVTPPFKASIGPGGGTGPEQKAQGDGAVEMEVGRMFRSLEKMKIYEGGSKRAKEFNRFVKKGNLTELGIQLWKEGFAYSPARVIETPTVSLHNAERRRGKVRRSPQVYFVPDAARRAYIAQKKALVGKLKGGWCGAASYFGCSGIPAWITRHSSGSVVANVSGNDKTYRIINGCNYSGGKIEERQLRLALAERTGAMARQIAAKLAGKWRN